MSGVREIRRGLLSDSPAVRLAMNDRLTHVKVLKQFWEMNDVHGAALYLSRLDDLAVAVDFFNGLGETGVGALKGQPDLALDFALLFSPFVHRLLESAFADYVLAALRTGTAMLRATSDTIKSSASWAKDLQSSGTRAKCEAAYDEFSRMRDRVGAMEGAEAPVGPAAVRLGELLESLRRAAREMRRRSAEL